MRALYSEEHRSIFSSWIVEASRKRHNSKGKAALDPYVDEPINTAASRVLNACLASLQLDRDFARWKTTPRMCCQL